MIERVLITVLITKLSLSKEQETLQVWLKVVQCRNAWLFRNYRFSFCNVSVNFLVQTEVSKDCISNLKANITFRWVCNLLKWPHNLQINGVKIIVLQYRRSEKLPRHQMTTTTEWSERSLSPNDQDPSTWKILRKLTRLKILLFDSFPLRSRVF